MEYLSGSIERITFHSEETGFCVLKVKARKQRDLVAVVGSAVRVIVGEYIEAQGEWLNNKNYGLQFKASSIKTVQPTTLAGIEKYLGSGMVRGVGPHFAKKLVNAFGENIFAIIENEPAKLRGVEGIGEKKSQQIVASWHEQKMVRDIMIFLQSHGVGVARAVRIYKVYGDAAIEKVKENPYQLALDIHGIGFKTADIIASNLGVAKESLIRACAGVRHVLQEVAGSGYCAMYRDELQQKASELLEIPPHIIESAIDDELKSENIVSETINGKAALFLASLYQAECSVAKHIQRLQAGGLPAWGNIDCKLAIPWVEKNTYIKLSDSQREAVNAALHNKVTIITGGPGVGKTTIVNSILKIVCAKKQRVLLCAPTGRAAKRLSETTRTHAKTIHRLLEFDRKTFAFKHNVQNPLRADLVIVDEVSMLDVVLMNNLLKAIPTSAALLLVGDVDQLPSVGPGTVLRDFIDSEKITTVVLNEIFRQAKNSKIIINSHRINEGEFPLRSDFDAVSDFYFIDANSPEDAYSKLTQLLQKTVPQRFGFNVKSDVQILTPMNRSALGARSLNIELQKILNPHAAATAVSRYGWSFAVNDKVIQTVNDYDKDVFNGDIGIISQIKHDEQLLLINFDGRMVEYDFSDLDELSLAYAITVHKSQGSEYPVVIIPLMIQHYMMLARNLLYTAITRGKKLVIIVGQKKALAIALHNIGENLRLTNLKTRL